MEKNKCFISKLNTGGGCLIDAYFKKVNDNIIKMITVDEEGSSLYTIEYKTYEEFVKNSQNKLTSYFGEKIIEPNDMEWIFWITLEGFEELENIIRFDCYTCNIDNGVEYDFLENNKIRQEKCESIMEIYCLS